MEPNGNKYSRNHDLGAPHSRSYNIKTPASILRRLEERQLSGRDLNLRVGRFLHTVKFWYDKGLDYHWSLNSGYTRSLRVLPPWSSSDFQDIYTEYPE
jgi:hypothetical protein